MGDKADEPRERVQRLRALMGPANEVPVTLPWSAVLARTADLAVLLVGARLYTTGIQLDVSIRGRGDAVLDLHPGAIGRPDAKGDVLCIGVAGANGFAATNVRGGRPSDNEPTLTPGGGASTYGMVSVPYMLHPLPPVGPVTVVCAWPVHGLDETRVEFDGSSLLEMVEQVEILWPEDDDAAWPPSPPKPKLPAGGWFAEHARPAE
jgi:hypothetical protein